ncbi:hypothetical protein, partial [Rothia aeria]
KSQVFTLPKVRCLRYQKSGVYATKSQFLFIGAPNPLPSKTFPEHQRRMNIPATGQDDDLCRFMTSCDALKVLKPSF